MNTTDIVHAGLNSADLSPSELAKAAVNLVADRLWVGHRTGAHTYSLPKSGEFFERAAALPLIDADIRAERALLARCQEDIRSIKFVPACDIEGELAEDFVLIAAQPSNDPRNFSQSMVVWSESLMRLQALATVRSHILGVHADQLEAVLNPTVANGNAELVGLRDKVKMTKEEAEGVSAAFARVHESMKRLAPLLGTDAVRVDDKVVENFRALVLSEVFKIHEGVGSALAVAAKNANPMQRKSLASFMRHATKEVRPIVEQVRERANQAKRESVMWAALTEQVVWAVQSNRRLSDLYIARSFARNEWIALVEHPDAEAYRQAFSVDVPGGPNDGDWSGLQPTFEAAGALNPALDMGLERGSLGQPA